jgi:hypothetical protein
MKFGKQAKTTTRKDIKAEMHYFTDFHNQIDDDIKKCVTHMLNFRVCRLGWSDSLGFQWQGSYSKDYGPNKQNLKIFLNLVKV